MAMVRMGMLAALEQPVNDGNTIRVGGRAMDEDELWYPCVTAAAYNLAFTKSNWEAGNVVILKAVTMEGNVIDVRSNNANLRAYGLDLSYMGNKQAATLAFAGHVVDIVVTVSGA